MLNDLKELEKRKKFRRIDFMFPDEGPLRRELYTETIPWFFASKTYCELVLFGGNRTGKTESGAYMSVLHATGEYPDWWEGRRFDYPTKGRVCGRNGKTLRESVQFKLLGFPGGEIGTGLIPLDRLDLGKSKKAQGVANLYDYIVVKHVSGGESIIYLKSYDQGRLAFEGTDLDYVWEDEEAPMDIHFENMQRVFDREGIVFNTYTPLQGQTELTRDLRRRATMTDANVFMSTLTWDNVPHINDRKIKSYIKRYPEHELKARRWGIPKMGSGAIFTTDFDEMLAVKPFDIPKHWPRAYGLDFGWAPHPTAAIWGAWDRDSDIVYLYSEHRMKRELPAAHAAAIKMRGDWIKGNSETAGSNAEDGKRMINIYRELGLHLIRANKAVEAGIYIMRERIEQGRLKVFTPLLMWREEYESYQRKDGKLLKEYDDLMDATRYLLSRMETFETKPLKRGSAPLVAKRFGDYDI